MDWKCTESQLSLSIEYHNHLGDMSEEIGLILDTGKNRDTNSPVSIKAKQQYLINMYMISYGKFYMDNEKIEKKKFLENKVSTIDCFCAADKVQPVCVTFDSSAVGNTCWWWGPYLPVYASLDNIYNWPEIMKEDFTVWKMMFWNIHQQRICCSCFEFTHTAIDNGGRGNLKYKVYVLMCNLFEFLSKPQGIIWERLHKFQSTLTTSRSRQNKFASERLHTKHMIITNHIFTQTLEFIRIKL